jgi:hypothetical protein
MTRNCAYKTSWGKTAFVLLTLLAMVNASAGMVVCIGAHGHVAVEPAGHDHCADAEDAHHCGPSALGSDAADHVSGKHCGPCVDIPLCFGVYDDRLTSAAAKTGGSVPAACIEQPAVSQSHPTAILTFAHCTLLGSHTLLSSIVLQV